MRGTVDMHWLNRVHMAWDRQRRCNIGPGVIGAGPRFARPLRTSASHVKDHRAGKAGSGASTCWAALYFYNKYINMRMIVAKSDMITFFKYLILFLYSVIC